MLRHAKSERTLDTSVRFFFAALCLPPLWFAAPPALQKSYDSREQIRLLLVVIDVGGEVTVQMDESLVVQVFCNCQGYGKPQKANAAKQIGSNYHGHQG